MAAEEGAEQCNVEDATVRIVNSLKPWNPTWTIAVELAVHVQARAFGFQIFNASQEETQKGLCIPACSGLAADHLLQLLRDRAAVIVSEGAGPLGPATFYQSIQSLHAAYFASGPYIEWKRKSNVALLDRQFQQLTYSHSIKKQAAQQQQQRAGGARTTSTFVGVSSSPEWVQQLAELSLFFLLWTEAANLRHTPELLWLLYHIMLSSNNQAKALSLLEAPGSHYSLVHWLSSGQQQNDPAYADALAHGFMRGLLLPTRNCHGSAMRLGGLLLDGPNPYGYRHSGTHGASRSGAAESWWLGYSATSLAERQCEGLRELKARGVLSSDEAAWSLSEMVEADLAFFGDGCIVLDMVIQPVFNLMAEQIGLMGAAGEQPALRLGYDDFNESACIDDVLASLSKRLEHEVSTGADPWDRLLLLFDKHAAETARSLQQSGNSDSGYRPVTFDMLQRYPRDFRRLARLAGMLKAIIRPAAAAADDNSGAAAGAAGSSNQSGASSVGGSAPVGHLLASLRVTDKLWAKLFKKSFIETRSLGAVAVAYSRLLIMHAVLLCCMSLWAYMIPAWTPSSMFTRAFWSDHGLKVAECASWGLFVHAVLHVIKDITIFHLLSTPKALRVQENAGDQNPVLQDGKDTADAGFLHRKKQQIKLWWEKQWRTWQLKEGDMVLVQPRVHPGKILKGHNVITLLFWLVCAFILLDSHIPSWPLNRALSKMALFSRGTARGVVMPVWAMAACVYVGLWLLHQFWKLATDSLPDRLASKLGPLARKDGRRAAEHFFPYGNMHNSQNFKRYLVNCLLWVIVFTGKFFFDFFVILKPLAQGPAVKLLSRLDVTVPWTEWAESILLVWSFWVASAFLVFYDTGLFWQLVGAMYSTLVLGMHRRVGHVKTWYDLTWSFPRLSKKLAQRMLPAAATALLSRPFTDEPDVAAIEAAAAAAIQHTESLERHSGRTDGSDDNAGSAGETSLPFPLHLLPCCPPSEVLFAQAWDKVVDDLRARDVLSNAEAGRLKYALISIAPDPKAGAWMLLPRFVAAGAAVEVAQFGVSSASQIDAVCRSFNLLVWLLHSLNIITSAQLSSMLLAKSAPAKGSNAIPRKASHGDVEKAAEVLKDSKELLHKLKSKLQDKGNAVSLADVDTQLLLEATMKGLRGLNGPKAVDVAAAAAPKSWQQQRQLPLQIIDWLLDMLTLTRGQTAPVIPEAVRVLCFFATSLNNPKMPTAANVACSRSMTTLTPHYGEDVMYALSQATAASEMKMAPPKGDEDGSTFLINSRGDPTETLKYLRVSYKLEWRNFVERLLTRADVAAHFRTLQEAGQAVPVQADVTHADFMPGAALHRWLHEALGWASMRGQLLQRTVHGMMYYETALQQLILMQAKVPLAEEAYRVAAEVGVPLRKRNEWVASAVDQAALLMARQKYAYVVSSQALGELQFDGKVSKRWLAHCIRTVIARDYPHLRIAYLDWENLGAPPRAQAAAAAVDGRAAGAADVAARNRTKGGGAHKLLRQYSVLLQWSPVAQCVEEQYRVRLPINLETDTGVILGEGKPENQNHAVIFCHSETLQTIDCNQDSYLAEALKLPNLLAEFDGRHGKAASLRGSIGSSQGNKDRKLSKALQHQGPALVGFREWVFSEDSGALAEFAAATERSFGTTVQRVMHNPGGCRFHYGHPDVWCKLFTMTNGGVSKATKALHVSEDVFGGYNVMLRGRDISYVDYIAVGKGRDMGFETINTFEAKIAGGNGEQVVSRDVHRLARRLNTARLLTWYHTGNGFFINTALLMYSLLVNAWLCLLLALSGSSSVGGLVLQDSLALLGGLQLMQLGSLSILVYVATVWLEDGLLTTLKNVLKQLVSGSLLFYVFRGQTSAHAFKSDVQYGGAKYLATGRGYKLKATPFMDVFQTYARSHMWFGGHLLLLMVTALCVGLPISIFSLWSYALVILALLVAPFWFNPFAFDWDENKLAGREFLAWMAGYKPAGMAKPQLWREFNDGQLRQAADDDGVQLGRSVGSVCGLAYLLPSAVIIGYAVFYMLDSWWKSVILVLSVNVLIGVLLACWSQATRLEAVKGATVLSRAVKFVLKFLVLAGLVTLFAFLVRPQQRWFGRAVVRILYVEFELARLTSRVLLAFLPHYQPARRLVNVTCWLGDFALGLLLLLLLFIGSLFGLLTRYQAAVLFSMGYAASYLAEKRLEDSEVGRLAKELQELQKRERLANQSNAQQQQQQPNPSPATGAAPGSTHTNSGSHRSVSNNAGGATGGRSVTAFTAAAASTASNPASTVTRAGAQDTPRSDSLPVQPEALIQQMAEYCQTLQEEASNSSSMDLPLDREHGNTSRSASASPVVPAAAGTLAGSLRASAAGGCSVTRGAAVTAAAAASTAAAHTRRSSCPDAVGDTADGSGELTGSTARATKGWGTPPPCIASDRSSTGSTAHEEAWDRASAAFLQVSSTGGAKSSTGGAADGTADDVGGMLGGTAIAAAASDVGAHDIQQADEWLEGDGDSIAPDAAAEDAVDGGSPAARKQPPVVTRIESAVGRTWD